MGITYHYVNLTKQEWFSASALGGNPKLHGLGHSLTAHAFELLLVEVEDGPPRSSLSALLGSWARDSIAMIGDAAPNWLNYLEQFADLRADLIPLVYEHDGFEALGEAADQHDLLYIQICHLIVTRQTTYLDGHMQQRFGPKYLQRYKQLRDASSYFVPKDLVRTTRR